MMDVYAKMKDKQLVCMHVYVCSNSLSLQNYALRKEIGNLTCTNLK